MTRWSRQAWRSRGVCWSDHRALSGRLQARVRPL